MLIGGFKLRVTLRFIEVPCGFLLSAKQTDCHYGSQCFVLHESTI